MSASPTDNRPFKRMDPTDLRWADPRPQPKPTTDADRVLAMVTMVCGPDSEVQRMLFGDAAVSS